MPVAAGLFLEVPGLCRGRGASPRRAAALAYQVKRAPTIGPLKLMVWIELPDLKS